MPRIEGVKKVLVIGSGAIKIGEAGEFDYSGAQAIKALKEEGVQVVLVNPNVATIQTDPRFVGEKAYFVPITPEHVERVIAAEKPDGVLLGFGGQTALNCGTELAERGILARHRVRVLGTSVEAIERADNRELFRKTMLEAGVPICESRKASSLAEALSAASEIGYPVMMRVAYTLGGQGTGAAQGADDLERMVPIALAHSRISQILVEKYVGGWKEIEYEVLRDNADCCMIVCRMENFDPMGVHTGDSVVVAPSFTVSDEQYERLRENSFRVLRALGLVGECNIQYAVHPETGEFRVIEVNSRLSRSSALASKATGYPIAYVTAKVALGYNLDEITNPETGAAAASLEPDVDYVVVKMPRWDFQKFRNVDRRLGTQMKSVGEVMAIGKSFEEAVQKAVRMLDIDRELTDRCLGDVPMEQIREELRYPTDERLFHVMEALRRGVAVDEVNRLTGIAPVFLAGFRRIVDYEERLSRGGLTVEALRGAKEIGFSDRAVARLTGVEEREITALRGRNGIKPSVKQIRTAKRFSPSANYLYLTYGEAGDQVEFRDQKKVIVLGSGCYRVGSSVEFDWCCVNTAWSLKEKQIDQVIMINCNPETVSTDFDVMDRLYFEELTLERVLDIAEREKPNAVAVSVGGQTPNRLAGDLERRGLRLLGSSAESIDKAEDREKFSAFLDSIGVAQPPWSKLETVGQAKAFAASVGYPVIVRPSYVLSGAAMNVAHDSGDLEHYLQKAAVVSKEKPVTVSKFMEGAREAEVDGVSDGAHVYLGPVIEHIENAGVHSGDSTMSIPSLTLSAGAEAKIKKTTRSIARGIHIKGPFNIQFLVQGLEVFVIECNLRASRSLPFVSKATGVNFIELAATAMTGGSIPDGEANPQKWGVKSPVFSFMRLTKADPVTSVEMVSTGEVACFGGSFTEAFKLSLEAAGVRLPRRDDGVLLTVGDDKAKAVNLAKKLKRLGVHIYATLNTAKALELNGVQATVVHKISEGLTPSVLDILSGREVRLVVNTPGPGSSNRKVQTDGYLIRRRAVELGIPLVTNLELADALVEALLQPSSQAVP